MKAQEECERIMTCLIRDVLDYQYKECTAHQVKRAIMLTRGIDGRTIAKWLDALIVFEYLIPKAPSVYLINTQKIPKDIIFLEDPKQ